MWSCRKGVGRFMRYVELSLVRVISGLHMLEELIVAVSKLWMMMLVRKML